MAQLKETFQNCHANPEAFAFLCDQLARTIARSTVGRQLLTDLADVLQSVLEDNFLADVVDGAAIAPPHAQVGVGGATLEGQLLWNLDGVVAPVALNVLPLVGRELAPGSTRCACGGQAGRHRDSAAPRRSLNPGQADQL